ncbi:MAG: PAP/fibrillin family protein, partial [Bdellovibrionales bacterium]
PYGSKQRALEDLVEQLLIINPQPTIKDRLPLLKGAWKQVWGPYEYRKNNRGVDPTLDFNNIYQVVFDGYYYNVNPSLDRNGLPKKIVLLRGAFSLDPDTTDSLIARFTDLKEIKSLPQNGLQFKDLPALSESKKLVGERRTLPKFLVKLFFGGGTLKEVYTDHNLRILFGSGQNEAVSNYIYIMRRVQ